MHFYIISFLFNLDYFISSVLNLLFIFLFHNKTIYLISTTISTILYYFAFIWVISHCFGSTNILDDFIMQTCRESRERERERPELITAASFLVGAWTDCFLWDSSVNRAPSALFIRPAFNFSSTLFIPVQHITNYIQQKQRPHKSQK